MIALLFCVVSGDCYGPVQLRQQVVYQQQYAVQYKAIPLYVVQDTGADAERLRTLEDAVLKLTQLAETQTLLLQQGNQLQLQSGSKYEAAARQVLQRSCVACHSGPSPKSDLDLTGEIDAGLKLLIALVVDPSDATMPPKEKPPLPEADVQTLIDWANEDRAALKAKLRGEVLK